MLIRRVTFHVRLIPRTPFRIGAGKGTVPTALSELPVVRITRTTGRESAYIPGSSLKGVLRSCCELIARTLLGPNEACNPVSRQSCGQVHGREFETNLRFSNYEGCFNVLNNICLICKIFGSTLSASLIEVEDAFPETEPAVAVRRCIAIDRTTGASAHGALFDYEYIAPTTSFTTKVHCLNLPNYALGLLVEAFNQIDSGLFGIGGFKSRGLGRFSVEITRIEITHLDKLRLMSIPIDRTTSTQIKLEALDEYDEPVEASNLRDLLLKLVEAWYKYVDKKARLRLT